MEGYFHTAGLRCMQKMDMSILVPDGIICGVELLYHDKFEIIEKNRLIKQHLINTLLFYIAKQH